MLSIKGNGMEQKMKMKIGRTILAAVASVTCLLGAATASATSITFTTSVGIQPSNAGVITITQVNSTTVDVLLDLINPTYGIMNSGGPHTPFAFNLAGSQTGISATFLQPTNGIFSFGLFTLSTGGGGNTPYGSYGIAINSSAGNGSSQAYYGDLQFDVSRTGGLSIYDFITNSPDGYYFSADLTDGQNTGAQAWNTPSTNHTTVPDGGATAMMLGATLAGLGLVRLRSK